MLARLRGGTPGKVFTPGEEAVGQNTNPREIQRPFAQRNAGGEDRAQRMSPEERRQLRRDIREAGREIHRPRC